MSNLYKSWAVSEDFPLYHNKNIPVYSPKTSLKHRKSISDIRIIVSNEHPDIFRIKGMKEGGYINPFLKEIAKVDREEYFKKMKEVEEKIKLIDLIKCSRKYSQDPKYYGLINNDEYTRKKKTIDYSPPNKSEKNKFFSLSIENNASLNKALKTLNMERERITRNNTKKNIDLEKMKRVGDNYIINKEDLNKIKEISCDFDIKKSAYISNYNNYKISESLKEDKAKEFIYPRKPVHKLNPINNIKTILHPPPYIFPKWSDYSESYYVLSQIKKGLNKKGGLFTEFVNKNFDKITVINNDIKNRLKQKREEEKIKKMNYNNNNNDINYGTIHNRKKIFGYKLANNLTMTRYTPDKYKNSALYQRMMKLGLKNQSTSNFYELEKQ